MGNGVPKILKPEVLSIGKGGIMTETTQQIIKHIKETLKSIDERIKT